MTVIVKWTALSISFTTQKTYGKNNKIMVVFSDSLISKKLGRGARSDEEFRR